jgi:hypothetical protein
MTCHGNIIELLKLIDRSISAVESETRASDAHSAQTEKIVKKLVGDAHIARETYFVGVSPYIVAHRLLCKDSSTFASDEEQICDRPARMNRNQAEDAIRVAYIEFIGERNVMGIIDRCIETVSMLLRHTGTVLNAEAENELREISTLLEKSDQYKVSIGIECASTGDCECGGEFVMYAESNERKCNSCGMTAPIWENAIDDVNIYASEVQKTKQNRHHPIQHCKTWIGRIQAWVGPDVPDSVYTQLRLCFTRDNAVLKNITCRRIRKYLKEKKLTSYNNYVPFIRKVLTGISPPQLTQAELTQLYETFNQVAKILQDMRPDNNINYYPVFIFLILDEQLPLGSRKIQILECIHLQSENTIKVTVNLYSQVCARMGRTEKPKSINWGEYKKLL